MMTMLEILKHARKSLYATAQKEAEMYLSVGIFHKKECADALSEIHRKIEWIDAELSKEQEKEDEKNGW